MVHTVVPEAMFLESGDTPYVQRLQATGDDEGGSSGHSYQHSSVLHVKELWQIDSKGYQEGQQMVMVSTVDTRELVRTKTVVWTQKESY